MKLSYEIVSKIDRQKETVFLFNKRVKCQLRAWNSDQIGQLGPIIKKVVKFAFASYKENEALNLDNIVDFLIDNLKDVKTLIFISLNRSTQKLYLLNDKGEEEKPFDEIEERIVDELEPEEIITLVKAILKLNLTFLFNFAKSQEKKDEAKKKETPVLRTP